MEAQAKHYQKILLFTQYFYPDITAASFRMYELYKYFVKNGISVQVVTTFPHRSEREYMDNSNEVCRIKVHFASPKNKFRYIYYYLEFVLKSFFVILRNRFFGCDLIFVSSPPIFIAIEALFLSILFRKKLLLDIRDLWPDTVVDLGKLNANGLIYRVLKSLEISLYRKASKIFCVSEQMREYILRYSNNVTVVYNGISEKDFLYFKNRTVSITKRDTFNVFYAGNIGMAQALDFLFDAAKTLRDEDRRDIFFHIIGEGVKLKDYQAIADAEMLKNVVFHKALEREILLDFLYDNADVLLLPLKEGFAFERTIPSKLFDYLLLKKPILYHIYGEGKEILDKLEIGKEFDLTSKSFLDALLRVYSNYEKYKEKANERNFEILKKFVREAQFQKILEALQTT